MTRSVSKFAGSVLFSLAAYSPAFAIEQHKVDQLLTIFRGGTPNINQIDGVDPVSTGSIVNPSKRTMSLPMYGKNHFLRGEDDLVSWSIYLNHKDVLSGIEIQLGFDNSATVLPEESKLELLVNGKLINTSPIRHVDHAGSISAFLDSSVLKPGSNKITLRALQYHRVDCSLDATYELWTRVLANKSFIRYSNGRNPVAKLSDIRGLARADSHEEKLYLVKNKQSWNLLPDEMLREYGNFVQEVSRVGKFENPKVEFLDETNHTGVGLDLFVGTDVELLHDPYVTKTYGALSRSALLNAMDKNVALVKSLNGQRVLLAKISGYEINGSGQEEQHEAILVPSQLEARNVSFASLDFEAVEYSGKRFSRQLTLNLPPEFYPSDYDSIKIHLFGSYASGLKRGQRLLVDVNGQSTASIPFSRQGGDVIYDRVLEIPLSAFKPGANTIELNALLELEHEKACSLTGVRKRSPALFLSDESFFEIPKLANAGRFPDVANTLMTGFPYRAQDQRGPLLIEMEGDREKSFEIASSLLAQISARANVSIPLTFDHGVASESKYNEKLVLKVAPFSQVPSTFAASRPEINWAALEDNWRDDAMAVAEIDHIRTASIGSNPGDISHNSQNVRQVLQGLPSSSPYYSGLTQTTADQENSSHLQAVFKEHARRKQERNLSFDLGQQLASIVEPIQTRFESSSETPHDDDAIQTSSQIVISQKFVDGAFVTFLGYPDHNPNLPLNLQSRLLRNDSQIPYHSLGFGEKTEAISGIKEPRSGLLLDAEWSLSNWRLVIAGWLSNQPIIFGGILASVILLWSYFTSIVLNRTNRSARTGFETDV